MLTMKQRYKLSSVHTANQLESLSTQSCILLRQPENGCWRAIVHAEPVFMQVVMTATQFRGNAGEQGGGGAQCDGCTAFNSTKGSFSGNNASAGGGGGLG